tara:strand:- start:265 stop:450 length:186 start_codon:yes stop_codon:yes gene_type:complete
MVLLLVNLIKILCFIYVLEESIIKAAKSILIHGFVSEIFDSVDNLETINYIKGDFDKWIEN